MDTTSDIDMFAHHYQPVTQEVEDLFYIPTTGLSHNAFLKSCQEIGRDYDKLDAVVSTYLSLRHRRAPRRGVFINYVSYAVPSPDAINIIYEAFVEHLDKFPNAKFVDLGCGSGVFCWLLNRAGIPKEKIIAVDLPIEEKTQKFRACYWDNMRKP